MKTWMIASLLLGTSLYAEAGFGGRDPRQESSYKIPVKDPELEPHAFHYIKIKWKSLEEGARVFDYSIPKELDGVGQDIELSEVTPGRFEGPKAGADCVDGESFNCSIKYHDLVVDEYAAELELDALYTDPEVRAGRGTVSIQFRRDPEPQGIMETIGEIEKSQRYKR
jgi:hypothetical protein